MNCTMSGTTHTVVQLGLGVAYMYSIDDTDGRGLCCVWNDELLTALVPGYSLGSAGAVSWLHIAGPFLLW